MKVDSLHNFDVLAQIKNNIKYNYSIQHYIHISKCVQPSISLHHTFNEIMVL